MVDSSQKIAALVHPLRSRIIAAILLAVFCAGTAFAAASATYTVTIYDGANEPQTVVTAKSDIQEILAQAGITTSPEDDIDISGFSRGKTSTIQINRAYEVTVSNGWDDPVTLTATGTVANAIGLAGLILGAEDVLNYPLDAPLTADMFLTIRRAVPVTITVDGQTVAQEIAANTVGEALAIAGVTVGEHDEVTPTADSALTSGMEIHVGRVTFATRTADEIIPYPTEITKTSALYTDQSKVDRAGVNGSKTVTYEDKLVDGVVTESLALSEEIHEQPVAELKTVGTMQRLKAIRLQSGKPISQFPTPEWMEFDANGLPTNYKSIIEGKAAAYTGGGNTATGKRAQPGYIAVDPKQIPYGTQMYIVSLDGKYTYGYCIAADTGGFVKKKTFTCDLYMNSESECYQWGARQVRIYLF